MSAFRSRSVRIDDLPVHLLEGGEGPALVYLHGAAPAGEWLPVHTALARHFTVYAPDHPGFGRTPRPDWLDGMDDLVLFYEEFFRTLGLERPHLLGFSLGGWIAAEFAVVYPDRPGGLVLLNAAGLHLEEAPLPDLAALQGRKLTETVFHDRKAAAEYWLRRSTPEARLEDYRAMTTTALLAWNPWFDPKLPRRLRRVRVPTLCLWAENDRLIPPVYGEAYRRAIPGARLELLPDCGHMAPVERPEAVARAVAAFFGR